MVRKEQQGCDAHKAEQKNGEQWFEFHDRVSRF
jgi:hypothetical protein